MCYYLFSFSVLLGFSINSRKLKRAFKMMKNGVYFIVIALLVAKLFKISIKFPSPISGICS